jgi:Protein of unknown function (DUF3072)
MAKQKPAPSENPKVKPSSTSNTEKDPDDWVSGDEPMTGAQASYLKTLSEHLNESDAFDGLAYQSRSVQTDRRAEARLLATQQCRARRVFVG